MVALIEEFMYNRGMNIKIKTTNTTLTPAISDYVSRRFEAVGKLFKDDSTVQCDIELAHTSLHHRTGNIFRAEIHITAKDKNLYASAEEADLYRAIDMVRDEILREVRSSKSKRLSLIRRGGARIKNIIKGFLPR